MYFRFLLCIGLLLPSLCFGLVDLLTISGNPPLLTINTATAGSQPVGVTNSTTSYTVTTAIGSTRITGQLNVNVPTGVTLEVSLQAPSGATSLGFVAMTTVAQNLVTGIPLISLPATRTINYQLSATVAAAPVVGQSVILTLTVL